MSLLEATETKFEREIDGAPRTFIFLNAYDRAELLRADLVRRMGARAVRKQKLIDNLKLAGIGGEQMYVELEKFDDADPVDVTEDDWIAFVNSPLNEVEIYRVSLLKTYNGEADTIAKSASLPLADKAKMCGLSLVPRRLSDDAGNPRGPAIPPTFGTPAENSTSDLLKANSSST